MATNSCEAICWTAVPCPDHGTLMTPYGRSATPFDYHCCDNRFNPKINTRHLWDECDSDRAYLDPEGWAEHEKNCEFCG